MEKEQSEVSKAARGLRQSILGGVMCVCVCVWMRTSIHSFWTADTVMWIWSPFYITFWLKLMAHPCFWVAYFQSICQMGWVCGTGSCGPRTLTVLKWSSVQPCRKVSISGPYKWYGLNDTGNDFCPPSLIWPMGWWWRPCWWSKWVWGLPWYFWKKAMFS